MKGFVKLIKIYELKRAKKILEKHKLLDKAQKAKIEQEVKNGLDTAR